MNVQTFDNVFDALAETPVEAANLKARAEIMSALRDKIQSWAVSQEAAADRLGITRPRLNDLLQGKMSKFSIDALINLGAGAGLTLEIRIAEPRPATTPSRRDHHARRARRRAGARRFRFRSVAAGL